MVGGELVEFIGESVVGEVPKQFRRVLEVRRILNEDLIQAVEEEDEERSVVGVFILAVVVH